MREYAIISPKFWIGETGRALRAEGKDAMLTALYLMTNPHSTMIGLYYIPFPTICHETASPSKGAWKALRSLTEVGFSYYDEVREEVWVPEMAKYQIAERLKPNDNRIIAIKKQAEEYRKSKFFPHFIERYSGPFHLGLESPSKAPLEPLRSQEQDQDQEQEITTLSGKPDASPSLKEQAREILKFLNERTGKNFHPVDTNLDFIIARLRSGATVQDCKSVIAKKRREWIGDPKMAEYLRPATLFNKTKFEQYRGELVEESPP